MLSVASTSHPARRLARAVLTGVAVALAVAAPSTGAVLADTSQAPVASPRLELREFSFQPTETDVPAAQPVTLTLFNAGVIPHDLVIVGPGMPPAALLNPGETRTVQVQFANPGVYVVMCTIAGHADAGMKGTIVAIAPAADTTATTTDSSTSSAPATTGDSTTAGSSDASGGPAGVDGDGAGY